MEEQEKKIIFTKDIKVKENWKSKFKKIMIPLAIILLITAILIGLSFAILYSKNIL